MDTEVNISSKVTQPVTGRVQAETLAHELLKSILQKIDFKAGEEE